MARLKKTASLHAGANDLCRPPLIDRTCTDPTQFSFQWVGRRPMANSKPGEVVASFRKDGPAIFVIMRVGRNQVHGTAVEQTECQIHCGFTPEFLQNDAVTCTKQPDATSLLKSCPPLFPKMPIACVVSSRKLRLRPRPITPTSCPSITSASTMELPTSSLSCWRERACAANCKRAPASAKGN